MIKYMFLFLNNNSIIMLQCIKMYKAYKDENLPMYISKNNVKLVGK